MAQRTAQGSWPEEGARTQHRGEGDAETGDAPGNDTDATDALLSLAGPRGNNPESAESWKYRVNPQGRVGRQSATANPAAADISMAATGEVVPEDAAQAAGDEQPAAPTQSRRGPYRRSTLDHMICQVEGCERELASLSPYHRRYRICEMHFKLDVFVRDGKRQRFCQQCGRCHDLNAFEGSKRSCRNRLNQHNARRRKKNPGAGGNGTPGEKGEGGQYSGSKRGGGEMGSGSKRRGAVDTTPTFPSWGLGSGLASAFTPQGGARAAQVGKSGASAFGPPGRVEGDPTRRGQPSDAEGGLAQDDGGLDPGLAAPGMTGHPGTLGPNDSPSQAGVSGMFPGMISPGSNPLASQMPLGGFPRGALGAGLWPHPGAGLPGLPNDPATLALQADMMSAQMAALGQFGGMPPNAQHTQTVQMLQAQLLRYQYMLHAMVTGAWAGPGGTGNAGQMSLEGLGFAGLPPMSAGMLGLPADPMLLGLGLPFAPTSEAQGDGQQPPTASVPMVGDPNLVLQPGLGLQGAPDASTLPPGGEGAVVQGGPTDPANTAAVQWHGKEEGTNPEVGAVPATEPAPAYGVPGAIDGQISAVGLTVEVPALHPQMDMGVLAASVPPVDASGADANGVKLEQQDPAAVQGEGAPPLPVGFPGSIEYTSQADVERIALKVSGKTPEDMSDEDRQKFTEWLSSPTVLETTTKSGCVHLSVRAFLPPGDAKELRERGVGDCIRHLLSHPDPAIRNARVQIHVGTNSALVSDGELRWDTKLNFTDAGVWEGWGPTNWNPPCIKAAYVAGTSAAVVTQGPHITSLQLHGSYLECDGVQVFCHHGDAVITTTVAQTVPPCCQAGKEHVGPYYMASVEVLLDGIPSQGLCWLEAERPPSLGAPYPLLVLPPGCDTAAAELLTTLQRMNLQEGRACDVVGPYTAGCMEGAALCSIVEEPKATQRCCEWEVEKHPWALSAAALPWTLWSPSARGLLADLGLVVRYRSSPSLHQCWESTHRKLLDFAAAQQLPAVAAMLEGFL